MNRYLHSIKWQAANATKTFNITEYRAMEEYHRVINCWKFTNWIKCYISASQWSVLVGGLKIGTQPLKHAQQISSINLFIHQLQRNVFNDKMEHAIKSLRFFFSLSLSLYFVAFLTWRTAIVHQTNAVRQQRVRCSMYSRVMQLRRLCRVHDTTDPHPASTNWQFWIVNWCWIGNFRKMVWPSSAMASCHYYLA